MIDPRPTRGPFGRRMGPQHTGGSFPTVRLDVMWLIDLLRGGKKPMAQQPQMPAPQFLSDMGDLSWVIGMIDWMVDRAIIPSWAAALVKFTLHMFVPAVRGRSDVQRNAEDLHKSWDQFVATHPYAAPYAEAARSAPGTTQKE